MGCNLLINGVYWGYYPLTNHLLTSWDIQVGENILLMVQKSGKLTHQLTVEVGSLFYYLQGLGYIQTVVGLGDF